MYSSPIRPISGHKALLPGSISYQLYNYAECRLTAVYFLKAGGQNWYVVSIEWQLISRTLRLINNAANVGGLEYGNRGMFTRRQHPFWLFSSMIRW